MLDDPPLPLTLPSLESLTSVQLQRLTSLHVASSLWTAGKPTEPAWRLPPSCPGSRSGCVPPGSQHKAQGSRAPGPPQACLGPGTSLRSPAPPLGPGHPPE